MRLTCKKGEDMSEMAADGLWSDTSTFVSQELLDTINCNAIAGDQDAYLPENSLQVLRDKRIFSCMIHRSLGGGGASLSECAAILHMLGHIDAGLAVGLTMHFVTAAHIDRIHQKGFQNLSDILLKIVSDQSITCSAGSEPNLGGAVASSSFVTVRSNDGSPAASQCASPNSASASAKLCFFCAPPSTLKQWSRYRADARNS